MNHGSLFSGIGAFDLASEWMGWNNLFQCEIEPFGQSVLKHYWPNAKLYADVKEFNAKQYEQKIDILTGSPPCQSVSLAGNRKGIEDDRYLWFHAIRVLGECKPKWAVFENVAGLLSIDDGYLLEAIKSQVEDCGYEVEIVDFTADAIGLPTVERHLWIVAKSKEERRQGLEQRADAHQGLQGQFQRGRTGEGVGWDISQSRFCRVGQRVSRRLVGLDRKKVEAIGDSFPPQMAFEIFRAIDFFEKKSR